MKKLILGILLMLALVGCHLERPSITLGTTEEQVRADMQIAPIVDTSEELVYDFFTYTMTFRFVHDVLVDEYVTRRL